MSPFPELIGTLTTREAEIAALVGRGYDCERVAEVLGIAPAWCRNCLSIIAGKITNPNEIKPLPLVMLWAARQSWERERLPKAS